jgi:hypothetical protein
MALSEEQKRANQLNKTYERYKSLTIGNCKNDALKEFQKLRRLECGLEHGNASLDHAFCISCGKLENVLEMDGGHYISRSKTITAFSRLNVWAQCKHCNRHLSGNPIGYRKGLIDRVGIESVEFLEEVQKEKLELTKWNYAVRREYYRSCIKRLGI